MLIRPAPPVEAIANKQGQSIVFYQIRNRQLARNWAYPTNPLTAVQQIIRAFFSQIASAWQEVDDADAAGWVALADQLERTDSLGRPYGFYVNNAYMQVNLYRLLNGAAITDTAPAYNPPATPVISAVAADFPSAQVFITHSQTGGFFFVRLTNALPSPRYNARINDLRIATDALANSIVAQGASPQEISITLSRVSFTEGDHVGAWVLPLSADYVPGTPFFLRSTEVIPFV